MSYHNSKYHDIYFKPAENGFVVCYGVKEPNPMMPESPFEDNMVHKRKEEVFQASGDTVAAKKKALKEAMSRFQELHAENLGLS